MPDYQETANARKVLTQAKESADGFLDAFTAVRRDRGARGSPTNTDQDLARASIVFAAAGLDSCVKHLIKESPESLAESDPKVREMFEKFVRRVVRDDSPSRLAAALLSKSPRTHLLESYIYELTGSSLQSFEELCSAAGALGIAADEVTRREAELIKVFRKRNQIIHELDVRFKQAQGQRDRRSRTKTQLKEDASLLLEIAEYFMNQVETKLAEPE